MSYGKLNSALFFTAFLALSGFVNQASAGQATEAASRSGDAARSGSYFQTNGARIFYQVSGQGNPMLLIHGYPLSGALFDNVRAQLSRRFKVVTVDLPGFGKSTLGTAKGGDANYAREMLALLTHLNITTAVVGGHSMGGQIVLEMYRQAPGRFTGMMLFDTNPAKASVIEAREFSAFPEQQKTDGIASIAKIVVPQMITGATLLKDPSEGVTMTGIIRGASPSGLEAGALTLARRSDYTSLLSTIKVPALVIVGIDDQIYAPPISVMAYRAIPGASIAIVPFAAHAPMFERPDFVVRSVLDWSEKHKL